MKKLLIFLVWFLNPMNVWANELPALFDVTDVAHNDILNVRELPDSTSDVLGFLAFNDRNVEVVDLSENSKWGLVNFGEISGWVSMRYMTIVPGDEWFISSAQLVCGGTEPFWDMTMNAPNEGMASFASMSDEVAFDYSIDWHGGQIGRLNNTIGLGGTRSDNVGGFSAVIRRDSCNDGMSGMNFGLAIDLFLHESGEPAGYEGCCSLRP